MKKAEIRTEIILNALHEPFYLYTINEACEAIGVSRKTLEAWIDDNEINTMSVGSQKRVAHFELMRFVALKYQGMQIKLEQIMGRAS